MNLCIWMLFISAVFAGNSRFAFASVLTKWSEMVDNLEARLALRVR